MPHNKLAGRVVFNFYTWWLGGGGSGGDAELPLQTLKCEVRKMFDEKNFGRFFVCWIIVYLGWGRGRGEEGALVAFLCTDMCCAHLNVYIYNKWHKV
jgi:hypothetical protein